MSTGQCIHMVWFSWKEGTSAETITSIMQALRDMGPQIDVVVSMSCGENFSSRTVHTHGLSVVLTSKDALPIYDAHPAHQHVVTNFIRPNLASVLAMDYIV